ncbi:TetR/AcrR family transcriptional regulator [Actinospongicola halichondriae]|uniref:TetR/AcrR family transcriptional regulator n=1 Tax=Actinospongicola halichondriae TaxID=3236844 RepID=UPI003D4C4796
MPKISDEKRAAARQRLIDATVAVAERDGVEALTTRSIVAEAGVSSGMFYGHFGSKEELLAAVVDQGVDELTTMVAAELDVGTPIDGIVRELLEQLIVINDLRALAVFRSASTTEEARETQRRINRRIVDAFIPVFDATVEAGLVRADVDAAAAIELIDVLIDGLNRRRDLDGFVSSDARLSAVIIGAIESFLLTQPPGDHA